MTPDQLQRAGYLLYGREWTAKLADQLGNSTRTVHRWSSGYWPIPDDVATSVAELCADRAADLMAVASEIKPEPTEQIACG